MPQLAYRFEEQNPGAGSLADVLAPTLSLFGCANELERLAADARAAGLSVRGARPLASLLEAQGGVLGDVVAVDCPAPGGSEMAALIRLDERAARAGAQLVVATGSGALEDVFGCLELAGAQILVDPTPAERALALGSALARLSGNRVREMDEADRLALLRLTEEVGRLASKLDRLALPLAPEGPAGITERLASPALGYRAERIRAPLPDPHTVHRAIRQRRLRERFFDAGLFADPAWDILLDLTAAWTEGRRVSVTSLCIAAAVPATTALRWIAQMTEMGILSRQQDEADRRRAFVGLSDAAANAMARYFEELIRETATAT